MTFSGYLVFIVALHFSSIEPTPYTSDCNEKLLDNREIVPDSAFTESTYEENFKGKYARESSNEDNAWCPHRKVGTSLIEYLGIDLGQLSVVKMIMTKGRNAVGYMSAQSYYIKYKQENYSEWKSYKNYSGSTELIGRKDPLNEKFISLEPPLIARWIRIFPYQPSNEKICLKLQLYGCINTNHVVEYITTDGSRYSQGLNSHRFKDTTYDGNRLKNGTLMGGIGKLSDRDIESGTTTSPIVDGAMKFVGWNRKEVGKPFVSLVFRFSVPRNFSKISLRVANHFDYDIRYFKIINMTFGWGFDGNNIKHISGFRCEKIESDDRIRTNRWIEFDIKGNYGHFVKVDLYFSSQWIILSEVNFKSDILEMREEFSQYQMITDKPDIQIRSETINPSNPDSKPNEFNILPLAQTLGLICGVLGFIILIGFFVLFYMHNRKKRNSPTKERVIQAQYPDDENLFLSSDTQYFNTKFTKGTFIPFNISPYKYYTAQRPQSQLQYYEKTLLTPNHHNIMNLNSTNVMIKTSPSHNNRGVDSCIYTSLPASDTESLGTPERKVNSHQIFPSVIQSSPLTPYWTNKSIRKPVQEDKIFYNSNAIDCEGDSKFMFQCLPDSQKLSLNNVGLIYTNGRHSQEYDSFKTQTLNGSNDDDELSNPNSLDFDSGVKEPLAGCCGNSLMLNVSQTTISWVYRSIPEVTLDSVTDLAPLGAGRWGQNLIDIYFPSKFAFIVEKGCGRSVINDLSSSAALVKILNENAPVDIRLMFHKEYTVSAVVNHDNICRVLAANFDPTSKRPFIISEYSVHGNLHNYFQNIYYSSKFNFFDSAVGSDGKYIISHQQTMKIILQLAEALKYLSEIHIVHRDVSSRNCLVFQAPDKEITIKLTDSAMSQSQYRDCYVRPRSLVSQSAISLHQPVYISSALLPLRWSACEIIIDDRFSAKSDVYAFGVTAWEIFTKCRNSPFSEYSDEQIVINAVKNSTSHIDIISSLTMPSSCAKEIIDFIQQCIHPQMFNRPNINDICTFLHNKISRPS